MDYTKDLQENVSRETELIIGAFQNNKGECYCVTNRDRNTPMDEKEREILRTAVFINKMLERAWKKGIKINVIQ